MTLKSVLEQLHRKKEHLEECQMLLETLVIGTDSEDVMRCCGIGNMGYKRQ